jgi:hypothetical protein
MEKCFFIVTVVTCLLAGAFGTAWSETEGKLFPPSNLRIKAVDETRIELSWEDNNTYEDGYIIQRKTQTGEWELIAETGPDAVSWTDREIIPDTEYFYRIASFGDGGLSEWSVGVCTSAVSAGKQEREENGLKIERLTGHFKAISADSSKTRTVYGVLNLGFGIGAGAIGIYLYGEIEKTRGSDILDLTFLHFFSSYPLIIGGGICTIAGIIFLVIPGEFTVTYRKFNAMPASTLEEIRRKAEAGEEYLRQLAEKGEKTKPWYSKKNEQGETGVR